MAPRPFPSPFRIGCDIARISRVALILNKGLVNTRVGYMPYLRHLLTRRELDYLKAKFQSMGFRHPDVRAENVSDRKAKGLGLKAPEAQRQKRFVIDAVIPGYGGSDAATTRTGWPRLCQYLAGRWAAKEACIKAVKPRRVTLRDVEVWPGDNGGTYAIVLSRTDEESKRPRAESGIEPAKEEVQGDGGDGKEGAKDTRSEGNATQVKDQERWQWLLAIDENLSKAVPLHEGIDGQIARLSISHDGDYAMAVAMAVSEPAAGDVGGEAAAREAGGE